MNFVRTPLSNTDLLVRQVLVTEVLGQYTHSVEFDNENEFVIVYGPNGVGKTKFLEVIEGLTSLKWRNLFRLQFGTATVTYQNGTAIAVARRDLADSGADEKPLAALEFTLSELGEEPIRWVVDSAEGLGFENWLRHETSWTQQSESVWLDRSDGEVADIVDLERRYDRVGPQLRAPRPPAALRAFLSRVSTYLIETQRLKIEPDAGERYSPNSRPRRTTSTIVEYANEMRRLLSSALAENSRITQQLDRTFPSRMLTQGPSPESSEQDIRDKYAQQNSFRSRLAQIALIGLEPELSLPERDLTSFEISMLDLYLRDADSKLESFEGLLEKISLLEEIINTRLLGKKLHVDAHNGLAVQRSGDNSPLDLDALSSGEQHEIILMYNLLFNVKPGGLVLIDEPEISLHVNWQVNFISDVQKIARIAGFQFVVATHSPQIINTWWGQARQLGPEDAEF